MAKLLAIAIHKEPRGEMIQLTTARVTTEQGVADDLRGKPGKRQVTVLTREGWEAACADAGMELPWHTRRANLYIEGVDLQQSQGRVLQLGELRLLITQETDPCNRMEELFPGLFAALAPEWRGGVCCSVIKSGEIRIGDEVILRAPLKIRSS